MHISRYTWKATLYPFSLKILPATFHLTRNLCNERREFLTLVHYLSRIIINTSAISDVFISWSIVGFIPSVNDVRRNRNIVVRRQNITYPTVVFHVLVPCERSTALCGGSLQISTQQACYVNISKNYLPTHGYSDDEIQTTSWKRCDEVRSPMSVRLRINTVT